MTQERENLIAFIVTILLVALVTAWAYYDGHNSDRWRDVPRGTRPFEETHP